MAKCVVGTGFLYLVFAPPPTHTSPSPLTVAVRVLLGEAWWEEAAISRKGEAARRWGRCLRQCAGACAMQGEAVRGVGREERGCGNRKIGNKYGDERWRQEIGAKPGREAGKEGVKNCKNQEQLRIFGNAELLFG